MDARKQLKAIAISLLIIMGSIFLSEWMLERVADTNSFQVGDLGGYFYKKIIVPLVSGALAFILVCIRREFDFSWQTTLRIFGILFAVALGSFFMHTVAINSGNIGWYKVPVNFDATGRSLTELSRLIFHRNDEIGYLALKELERRGQESADTLLKVIEENRKRDPYHETYEIRKVVEILAKQKDKRLIPVLYEMLKSEHHTSIFTYKDGTRVAQYGTRIEAKNLLKEYFNIDVNVETEKIMYSPSSNNQ